MKVKNANISSKKTREKIKKAFANLMEEKKELNKITVTDLVKIADITRASFYTHYENVYEVAKDLQDETFDVLIHNIHNLTEIDQMDSYFNEIFSYLEENEDIYSMIFSSNTPFLFTKHLDKLMNQKLLETLSNKPIKDLELTVSFFVDGCMNLVIKHFRHEVPYSLEEINHYVQKLFKNLFLS